MQILNEIVAIISKRILEKSIIKSLKIQNNERKIARQVGGVQATTQVLLLGAVPTTIDIPGNGFLHNHMHGGGHAYIHACHACDNGDPTVHNILGECKIPR